MRGAAPVDLLPQAAQRPSLDRCSARAVRRVAEDLGWTKWTKWTRWTRWTKWTEFPKPGERRSAAPRRTSGRAGVAGRAGLGSLRKSGSDPRRPRGACRPGGGAAREVRAPPSPHQRGRCRSAADRLVHHRERWRSERPTSHGPMRHRAPEAPHRGDGRTAPRRCGWARRGERQRGGRGCRRRARAIRCGPHRRGCAEPARYPPLESLRTVVLAQPRPKTSGESPSFARKRPTSLARHAALGADHGGARSRWPYR